MKFLKNSFLGTLFILAIGISSSILAANNGLEDEELRPCSTVASECGERFPDNYWHFNACMIGNGCGGGSQEIQNLSQ